eukprot:TRINITY_DN4685_c0_g1_i6.p1 TRINITY_DN4685_c0_g1~~TRINITY_DN4685_c0_g1_i6.p1  ORF type:complete len:428 (-),score=76.73 TRINITY_DN4685_c0_g1_i6:697-1980(-)
MCKGMLCTAFSNGRSIRTVKTSRSVVSNWKNNSAEEVLRRALEVTRKQKYDCKPVEKDVLQQLAASSIEVGSCLGPAKFSALLAACASSSVRERKMWECFVRRGHDLLHDFDDRQLSSVACSIARSPLQGSEDAAVADLYSEISSELQRRISKAKPRTLANIVWAFARMQWQDPKLFESISVVAASFAGEFKIQELASTAWAYARIERLDEPLFNAIAEAAKPRLWQFNSQELSNTAWAFSRDPEFCPPLHPVMAAGSNISSSSNQTAAEAATSHPRSSQNDFLDALACAAAERSEDFSPQGLAATAVAFARIRKYHEDLLNGLISGAKCAAEADKFNPQELANFTWAFAQLCRYEKDLFESISKAAISKMGQSSAQNLSNTAWAYAVLGIHDAQLFQAIAGYAMASIPSFNEQNLANISWAFATAS